MLWHSLTIISKTSQRLQKTRPLSACHVTSCPSVSFHSAGQEVAGLFYLSSPHSSPHLFSFLLLWSFNGSFAVTYFHENSIAGSVPSALVCQRFRLERQVWGLPVPRCMRMGETSRKPLRQGTCRSLPAVTEAGAPCRGSHVGAEPCGR